ncbi:MAG: GDP-mannose 4,6-dehydratase [Gammaproteobacteria bacterium]
MPKDDKRALICGVSGQDGSYLAKFLLEKGYTVFGAARDAELSTFQNLVLLGIREQVHTLSMALTDFRSVAQVLDRTMPTEIYNLAGQSSVGLSFEQPVETFDSIGVGVLNLLEAIRFMGIQVRFYNACSGECFGNTGDGGANEETPFRPRSPYAVAKAAAFWEVANYREGYGLHAVSGILFNHESPLRPGRFVTRKIVSSACRIAQGSDEKLLLGDLTIRRDWGWAPEYVQAMWMMLQREAPEDFVVATGQCHALEDFTSATFSELGLNWRDHVVLDRSLFRPTDLRQSLGDAGKARRILGWTAKQKMQDVVRLMIAAEQSGNPLISLD